MSVERDYPASSKSGSHPFQFRGTLELFRMCEEMFDSRKFGFSTISDMYRAALHHYMEFLSTQDPSFSMDYIRAMNASLNKSRELVEWQEILDDLSKQTRDLVRNGHEDEAQDLVDTCHSAIIFMKPGSLKNGYLEQLMGEFGHLVRIIDVPAPKYISNRFGDMTDERDQPQ